MIKRALAVRRMVRGYRKPSGNILSSIQPYLPLILVGGFALVIYKKFFRDTPLGISNGSFESLTSEERKNLAESAKTSLGSSTDLVARVKNAIKAKNLVVNASHVASANALETAMKGAGTDWSKIKLIKTMAPATLQCVFVAYGIRSTKLTLDVWGAPSVTGNLIDHLQDDLSEKEFSELLPYFKKANIL